MDVVDTNGRAGEKGPAEDYLRYFTDHFTDDEWETIKRWLFGGWVVGGGGGWLGGCWSRRFEAENDEIQHRVYAPAFVFSSVRHRRHAREFYHGPFPTAEAGPGVL